MSRKNDIELWQIFTDIEAKKRSLAVFTTYWKDKKSRLRSKVSRPQGDNSVILPSNHFMSVTEVLKKTGMIWGYQAVQACFCSVQHTRVKKMKHWPEAPVVSRLILFEAVMKTPDVRYEPKEAFNM